MAEPTDSVLRSALAELDSIVLHAHDISVTLGEVAAVAADTIPGVEAVSITLADRGVLRTAASTGALARHLDERQYELGHGPCLESIQRGHVTLMPDAGAEPRWPAYLSLARERGLGSQLCVPLRLSSSALTDERARGALNGYSTRPGALSRAVEVAEVFARYAAVCLHSAQRPQARADVTRDLLAALSTTAVVAQAKGILMAVYGGSPEQASERLEQEAARRRAGIHQVAQQIVDTRGNPDGLTLP